VGARSLRCWEGTPLNIGYAIDVLRPQPPSDRETTDSHIRLPTWASTSGQKSSSRGRATWCPGVPAVSHGDHLRVAHRPLSGISRRWGRCSSRQATASMRVMTDVSSSACTHSSPTRWAAGRARSAFAWRSAPHNARSSWWSSSRPRWWPRSTGVAHRSAAGPAAEL